MRIPNPRAGEGLEIDLHFYGKWTVRIIRAMAWPLLLLAGRGGFRAGCAALYVPYKGRVSKLASAAAD